jgi:hypothetical protein
MSITIAYRGKMRSSTLIDPFIDDVIDICHEIGWRYYPVHQSNIMPAKGLFIVPAGSEPIVLTFLPNGLLYDALHFVFTRNPEQEVVDEQKHTIIYTKTRYAGADAHMALMVLFSYLKDTYFREFEMRDESGYWSTKDVYTCQERFGENYELVAVSDEEYEADIKDGFMDDEETYLDQMHELLLRRGGLGIGLN